MAVAVLKDAYIELGSDLSAHSTNITLEYSADEVEETAMGDSTHLFAAGTLKTWSLSVDYQNDYTDSSFDDLMFAAVGTSVAIVLRPTSAVVGVNNPEYTGNGILTGYNPIQGSTGELAGGTLTFAAASDLARAES